MKRRRLARAAAHEIFSIALFAWRVCQAALSSLSPLLSRLHPKGFPMIQVRGYAAHDAQSPLVPFTFERRERGPHDVQIEILYAGICHSDLHQARNDWSNSLYPMVPGHEIVGRVVAVGAHVKSLKAGDYAGVG
jgi:uncharacterized zinc-type alcohol dehydrogenase-like protein